MTKGVIIVVRMKCDFDSTGVFSILRQIFILSAIFSISLVPCFIFDYTNVSGILFIIFIVSIIALLIISRLKGGIICILENKIIIAHKFFNKNVLVSSISYRDIKYAEYNVEAVRSRVLFFGYNVILKITKKSKKTVKITAMMYIKENFPMDYPDEYKEYLNEQPLVKICSLINERAGKF